MTVTRHVTPVYFIAEACLAVTILAIALKRRDRIALLLFVVMVTFNVLFEVIGLIGGYRTYDGLTAYAAVLIGLSESGTAAAIVWMTITASLTRAVYPVGPGVQEMTE